MQWFVDAARRVVTSLRRRPECPLCGVRPDRFLPFGLDLPVLRDAQVVGGGYRQNAMCPNCGCIDRERLLHLFLCNKTDLFHRPIRLLHIAPEARVSAVLRSRSNIEYLTADLLPGNAQVVMDITQIQLPDESFDAIICNHVLEHIVDDGRAMAELLRVLRPHGWGILQVPIGRALSATREDRSVTDPSEREARFGQADHVRLYGADYSRRLTRVGFDVQVFSWMSEPGRFGGYRNAFGLNRHECVYYVTKPGGRSP